MRKNKLTQVKNHLAVKLTIGIMSLALVCGLVTGADAQTRTRQPSLSSVAEQQVRTGITTYRYAYKSNAVGKYNAEIKRGKYAKLYYDNSRKQWAVDVANGLKSSSASETGTAADGILNPKGDDTVAVGVNCEEYLKGGTTLYFPTKQMTEDMYKAHLKQGDCAKMWFDNSRQEWALVVRAVLKRTGSRGSSTRTTAPRSTAPVRRSSTATTIASPDYSSADGGKLPNGASVTYFPTRESAEGIYKASLKQGDWAKMWYDQNRKAWAVAIKVR